MTCRISYKKQNITFYVIMTQFIFYQVVCHFLTCENCVTLLMQLYDGPNLLYFFEQIKLMFKCPLVTLRLHIKKSFSAY